MILYSLVYVRFTIPFKLASFQTGTQHTFLVGGRNSNRRDELIKMLLSLYPPGDFNMKVIQGKALSSEPWGNR